MLQSIRDNSQSIVAKVIVGLIVVTFALFGVESLVSLTSESDAPATVNGEEITSQELYQATELQRRQLLSQMGENADPALLDDGLISSMVLDSLIEQKSLLLAAEDKNLMVSDRMIDQMIVNTADFQVDGQFNRNQFEAALRNAGFTPLMYRDLLRKERVIEQERNAYQLSAFAVPQELERIVALDRQTRDIRYFVLPLAGVMAQVNVSEDDIKSEYEAERSSLMTQEQVAVEYILLNKNDLRDDVDVSDDELKAQYDQYLASFQAEEERDVAHILIEVTAEQDDAEALAKVAALQARIKAGESFESLAKSESDDVGSASSGGSLGVNGKGVFSEPFERSMYELSVNDVSEPVRTEFGYHLIKVNGISKEEVSSFAELKYDLAEEILDQKVEAIYVERLEQMADITFSAGDLVEPSEVLGLTIVSSEPFDKVGGTTDVTRNAKVISAVFSNELIQEKVNSPLIELDKERTVVARVKTYFEPREQAFEEVSSQLKQQLVQQKASDLLESKAKGAVAQLNAGEPLSTVAAGVNTETKAAVSRSTSDIPLEVRNLAFSLAKPIEGKAVASRTVLNDGGVAVVLLTSVNTPEVALSEEEVKSMAGFLGTRFGQQEYQALVSQLKSSAEIEKR
ncbi:SurA N-terminal domain-containing protein [Neptunomonas japonica]|uniref:Periplasmic chaperone PpiD n=1 Tax=Neptunomonas japonica JAMM 1380 TaxID=1441457 RepID=A0A7R6PA30_9GAMM|nr:SurA N-terminal domain-containing protein [Neptunomonas japonica]BBB30033.1 peptidyl-prolyl cis-trans isomerase D [Neptunomonas japonica JAMM 1380]